MSLRWVRADVVYAIHDRQIAQHGGLDGVRDRKAIESALARPQNLAADETADAARLAAAYAFGLASNHGFADGNKRVAWVVARLFLADNGYRFEFEPADAVAAMQRLAAGALTEAQFADWLRRRITGLR